MESHGILTGHKCTNPFRCLHLLWGFAGLYLVHVIKLNSQVNYWIIYMYTILLYCFRRKTSPRVMWLSLHGPWQNFSRKLPELNKCWVPTLRFLHRSAWFYWKRFSQRGLFIVWLSLEEAVNRLSEELSIDVNPLPLHSWQISRLRGWYQSSQILLCCLYIM